MLKPWKMEVVLVELQGRQGSVEIFERLVCFLKAWAKQSSPFKPTSYLSCLDPRVITVSRTY